jgi:alkyl hydroperoxide reductase subunit AhpF
VDVVFDLGLSGYSVPMGLIADDVASQLKEEFAKLVNPVRLAVFSQALADPESEQVKRLLEELAALDPSHLSVEPVNFVLEKERAEAMGVTRTPAVAIFGTKDYGIRFYGVPHGYEFGTLLDAIRDVSHGEHGLSPQTVAALEALERPVHIQVFSTPT